MIYGFVIEGAGGCDVCEVQFTSREEAETHMNSEDHETAQVCFMLDGKLARCQVEILLENDDYY